MREIIELFQGDTSGVKLTRPDMPGVTDALDGNWICQQAVLDCEGVVVVAVATVADKTTDAQGKERFVVAVSPSDSATLAVPNGEPYQDYTWVIQLENPTTTPPYNKEHMMTLRIRAQGIP
ncbi:MAG: hypothetical protein JKX92_06030 [Porticoccaceae bacterium]|nr:hypothetical protein [Porticoccaceae bacterium]